MIPRVNGIKRPIRANDVPLSLGGRKQAGDYALSSA
jgi:hypothetical protein